MFKIFQFLSLLAFINLTSCTVQKQHFADAEISYLRADNDNLALAEDYEQLVSSYRVQLEDDMNTELGELPETIKKDRPNSNMGNWFCDALLVMSEKYYDAKVDFAVQNYGGLRIPSIQKGKITKSHIFELMPFDNKLFILELSGSQVQELLDKIADDGGWPLSHTVQFTEAEKKATEVKIHNLPLDPEKKYNVGIPDYVANGGGGCDFLIPIPSHDTGINIREAIIEYLLDLKATGTPITINNTKRIR